MSSHIPPEFLHELIEKAKIPRLSSDKLCWQIIKNVSIHRSPEGQVFISLSLGKDGRITFPIRDPLTADIIFDRYIQECSWAPNPRSVSKAIRAREAEGHVGYKQTYPVFTRIAGYGERFVTAIPNPTRIVIDLHNLSGDVITIDPDGWKAEPGGDFFFLRHNHMKALPVPPQANPKPPFDKVTADSHDSTHTQQILTRFRDLLNPATTRDFHRMLIWLLSAARGSGPVPILAIEGPTASGKSTVTNFLRQAVDPSQGLAADHTARNRDLFEHASRNWVTAFEAVRKLSPRVADFINSLAGGITFHVKQRYDPHEPAAVFLQRPIIMNLQPSAEGKDPISAHGDSLPTRTLRAKLAPIAKEKRLGSDALCNEFKQLHPELFALLCTAISVALKRLPDVDPKHLPEMADAALWAIAAAPALGLTEEEILAAFEPDQPPNLKDAVESFMEGKENWTGTASDLHEELQSEVVPTTPKLLAQQLRQLTTELTAVGLSINFKPTKHHRLITIQKQWGGSPDPQATPWSPPTNQMTGDAEPQTPPQPPEPKPLTLAAAATSSPNTISHKNEPQRHPVTFQSPVNNHSALPPASPAPQPPRARSTIRGSQRVLLQATQLAPLLPADVAGKLVESCRCGTASPRRRLSMRDLTTNLSRST